MADYVQSAVNQTPAMGRPGLAGDAWAGQEVDTKLAAEAGIVPGRAVALGSAVDTIVINDDGYTVYGVAMCDAAKEQGVNFGAGDAIGVMRKGRVFVEWEGDLPSQGDAVYVVDATGVFRGDDTDATILSAAKVSKVDSVYSQVEIDINLP